MAAESSRLDSIVIAAISQETSEEAHWSLPALSWRGSTTTIALTVLTLFVALWPGVSDALQFDRTAIAAGQWWRIVTGHFTHWSNEHLAWDLLVFFGLGCLCERPDRQRFLAALTFATLLIPVGLCLITPDLQTYRGLSGLDTALFVLLSMTTLRTAFGERNWLLAVVIAGLLVGFVAKTASELVSGGSLFVDSAANGFQPVPLAHVIGAVIGIAVAVINWRFISPGSRRRCEGSSSQPARRISEMETSSNTILR